MWLMPITPAYAPRFQQSTSFGPNGKFWFAFFGASLREYCFGKYIIKSNGKLINCQFDFWVNHKLGMCDFHMNYSRNCVLTPQPDLNILSILLPVNGELKCYATINENHAFLASEIRTNRSHPCLR